MACHARLIGGDGVNQTTAKINSTSGLAGTTRSRLTMALDVRFFSRLPYRRQETTTTGIHDGQCRNHSTVNSTHGRTNTDGQRRRPRVAQATDDSSDRGTLRTLLSFATWCCLEYMTISLPYIPSLCSTKLDKLLPFTSQLV